MTRVGVFLVGAIVFGALVLLNVGGYRYGVSDQAFYIPIVMQQITPTLFPHDAQLLAAQDRFFAFDDWFAAIMTATHLSLPSGFLAAYGLTLAGLYGAIVGLGRTFYSNRWTVAGLVVGLTMRHRIPDTAVNSLEGYFHPRLLAFAFGLWAILFFLRGRTWLALTMTGLAACVHPTTALWFIVLVGTGALVCDQQERRRLLAMSAVGTAVAVALLAGPLRPQLVAMDPTWVSVLSVKDYLDPVEWPLATWGANMGLGVVIGGIYLYRRRLGLASIQETGLVAGSAALILLFLLSVPLAHAQIALVVQLQISRIFWLLDVVASLYMGWLLIESPAWSSRSVSPSQRPSPRRVIVAVLFGLALARGVFVTAVAPAGRPISTNLAAVAEWPLVMAWASRQPVGTHVLADPGHANLYGSSVRVASGRDVYLESVKDVGIAIYSADIAHRVKRRVDDLGHFAALNAEKARQLAARYDLDFLITEHDVALPVIWQTEQFQVYDLAPE